jgi:hypothetical protein
MPVPVPVPRLVGLSPSAAVTALTQAGLIEGTLTKVISSDPPDSVTRSIPSAGSMVDAGTAVDIDVSVGLWRRRWWESSSWIFFSALGLLAMAVIIAVLYSTFASNGDLLEALGESNVARGLITFLIAFTTVVIALIIVVSSVTLEDSPENDKRFDRGKQVLSILIGVLGTIVGFYYGSSTKTTEPVATNIPRITSQALKNGIVGQKYEDVLKEEGGKAPFRWKVTPDLPHGLVLADDGKISGQPDAESSQTYQFSVTDGSGSTSETRRIDLKIDSASKH